MRLKRNGRNKADGRDMLRRVKPETAAAAFFDPQYRGVMTMLGYGNEGVSRGKRRSRLPQTSDAVMIEILSLLDTALQPSGYVFWWLDKFMVASGEANEILGLSASGFDVVDLLTWDGGRMGMGKRTRQRGQYIMVLQKWPIVAAKTWSDRGIPDVWPEPAPRNDHVHAKPIGLQRRLIEAVTEPGDLVLDPCAGGYTVLEACRISGRRYLGCDLRG